MPKKPVSDLSIYGEEKTECKEPSNEVKNNYFSPGTMLMNGCSKVKSFCASTKDFGDYLNTREGQIKVGSILLAPIASYLLVRKRCSRLVRYGTPILTTGIVSTIHYPREMHSLYCSTTSQSLAAYDKVSKNQSRLWTELQNSTKTIGTKIDEQKQSSENNNSQCNTLDADEFDEQLSKEVESFFDADEEEIIISRNDLSNKDDINKDYKPSGVDCIQPSTNPTDTCDEVTSPDQSDRVSSPNELEAAFQSKAIADGITKHKLLIRLEPNQTLICDCEEIKKKEQAEVPEVRRTNDDETSLEVVDVSFNNNPQISDYGQSVKDDDDMYSARERE